MIVPKKFQTFTEGRCHGICDQGYKININSTCNYDKTEGLNCESKETQISCELSPCPVNYGNGYGPWEDWGSCSKTCMRGKDDISIQYRQRICKIKNICSDQTIGMYVLFFIKLQIKTNK